MVVDGQYIIDGLFLPGRGCALIFYEKILGRFDIALDDISDFIRVPGNHQVGVQYNDK